MDSTHAICAYWTLFLICGTWDCGTALVYHGDERWAGGQDSNIRLLRLRSLAFQLGTQLAQESATSTESQTAQHSEPGRLPGETWRLIRSLASSPNSLSQKYDQKRDSMVLPGIGISVKKRETRADVLSRFYRATTPMENFRINYGELHKDLSSFVSLLSTRYVPGAPEPLQYVTVIPTILKLDDAAFATGDVDQLVTKASVVMDVTRLLLAKVSPFVKTSYQDWLFGQINKLSWWMNVVDMSLLSLRLGGSGSDGISIVSGGVGGINVGVQNGMSRESLLKLADLVQVLQS